MKTPFTKTGFWEPACIGCETLNLSKNAEKLRKYLAAGLIGSCAGRVRHSFGYNGLTVYLCDRHAAQRSCKRSG